MRSRRRSMAGASIVGIAAVLAACGSSPSTLGKTPGAVVLDAALSANQQQTALIEMSLSSSGLPSGSTVGGTGTGAINFDSHAEKITFRYSGSRVQGFQLEELLVGGHVYLAPSGGGKDVASVLPGKEWIEGPGNFAGQATSAATQNPFDTMSALRAKGDHVVDLGASSIAGRAVEEYAVTVNPDAVLAQINKEHLPPSVVEATKALLSGGPPTLKVWVQQSNDSLRQVAVTMPFPASTFPGASLTVTMGLTDYGAPVSIEAPPASVVASYAQFEQAAKQAAPKA